MEQDNPFTSLGKWIPIRSHAQQKKDHELNQLENLEELNNLNHELIAEDFADSPFADREPNPEDLEKEEALSTANPL